MTIRQFVSWLDCHDKAELVSAGVLNPDITMNFLHRIKEMLPKALAKGKDRALAVMFDLFNQFPADEYEIAEEAEEIKNVYLIQTERLIRYFFNSGYELISAEPVFYSQVVPGLNDEVTGRIDVAARNALGQTEYIQFDVIHKNGYKHKARKPANKPEAAPELFLPALSLKDADARYSVWYLRGGEDKKGVFPEFETKDGANIALTDFGGDLGKAQESLDSILELRTEERKCDACSYSKVCRAYPVTTPAVTIEEAKSSSAKAVTLTPEQQMVADFREGSLCVVAIPGSGKTKTLISRMVSLVRSGISIANILFVTFTNKACGEISQRVADVFGDAVLKDANIKTFNGFGYDILKANEKLLGRKVKLAKESTRRTIIRKVLLQSSPRMEGVNMAALDGEFGLVKRVDDWIQQYEQFASDARFMERNPNIDFDGFYKVYEAYKEEFRLEGYINYDDQIRLVVELFEGCPELAKKYSQIFEYVMVDEYQDVNYEQVRLLQLLCRHGNIVAVGDDDQGIYGFRGGSNEYMLNFSQYFKNAKTVGLTKNFRSNDKIVKAAEACILHNGTRISKQLRASFTANLKPVLLNAPNNAELINDYIVPMIKAYGARNVAVIARTNATLSKLRPFLEEASVLSTNPKDYLVTDRSFMLLYDLMSVYLYGPDNASESFTRLYSQFVSRKKVEAQYGESFYAALVRYRKLKPILNTVATKKIYETEEGNTGIFGRNLLSSYEIFDYCADAKEALEAIIHLWFPDADSNMLIAADMLAKNFEESGSLSVKEMYLLMDAMIRYADKTRISYDYGEAINLLTAHDSKGKEFAGVIVLDADKFLDTDEEGRRVLYVALTRAKHTLVITSSGDVTNDLIFEELGDTVRAV